MIKKRQYGRHDIISALKQEAYEFKTSLGYIEYTAANKTKLN